jgi:multiple sugar transport system ATP-binding protein
MTMADKIVVMNAGKVEQVGTPLELYDNPANLFVAGFIGSPAMNFLPEKRNGRDVLVGMRPEHLEIAANGAAGTLPAEVVVVEPTGADTHIFCKVGGVDVTAVVRERHDFHPGEALRLRPKLTYVFDPSSGARLA